MPHNRYLPSAPLHANAKDQYGIIHKICDESEVSWLLLRVNRLAHVHGGVWCNNATLVYGVTLEPATCLQCLSLLPP